MSGKFIAAMLAVGIMITGAAQAMVKEPGVSDSEILVGTSNILTGPSQYYGLQTNIGINCYFNTLNSHGGVFGRKIKVVSEDDKYDPELAITNFRKLLAMGAFALIGIGGSPCAAKYVPMAEANQEPLVGFYCGPLFIDKPVKRYSFHLRPDYQNEMRQAVNHLWNEGNQTKIAIIYQNDAYGSDLLEGVKQGLRSHNAELVAAASYTRNINNITEALSTVKKANPNVVILGAVYKPCADIIKMAHEQNWHPIFLTNSGSGVDAFIKNAGPDAEGVICSDVAPSPDRTDLPGITEYIKALQQYYPNERPNASSLKGYLDAMAFAEGLKRAGKEPTRQKFITAMEGIANLDVGMGKDMKLSISPTDHVGFHHVFFGIIKNGQVETFSDWKHIKKS